MVHIEALSAWFLTVAKAPSTHGWVKMTILNGIFNQSTNEKCCISSQPPDSGANIKIEINEATIKPGYILNILLVK